MRLHRPYIPIEVRAAVAERQVRAIASAAFDSACVAAQEGKPDGERLRVLLAMLFGGSKFELHHRPALVNRRRYVRNGKTYYDPPANDPAHLAYLAKPDHEVETRVRGVGAQRSDLAQRRYLKRVARNRERKKTGSHFTFGADKSKAKRKWPSRPFPGRKR